MVRPVCSTSSTRMMSRPSTSKGRSGRLDLRMQADARKVVAVERDVERAQRHRRTAAARAGARPPRRRRCGCRRCPSRARSRRRDGARRGAQSAGFGVRQCSRVSSNRCLQDHVAATGVASAPCPCAVACPPHAVATRPLREVSVRPQEATGRPKRDSSARELSRQPASPRARRRPHGAAGPRTKPAAIRPPAGDGGEAGLGGVVLRSTARGCASRSQSRPRPRRCASPKSKPSSVPSGGRDAGVTRAPPLPRGWRNHAQQLQRRA